MLAGVVALAGGFWHVAQAEPAHRTASLPGEPGELRSVARSIARCRRRHSASLIQLGLLLLIATPVACERPRRASPRNATGRMS